MTRFQEEKLAKRLEYLEQREKSIRPELEISNMENNLNPLTEVDITEGQTSLTLARDLMPYQKEGIMCDYFFYHLTSFILSCEIYN